MQNAPSPTQASNPNADTFREAVEHHCAGRIQDALRLYHDILRVEPNHAEANHNLGILADGVGQTDTALRFLDVAIHANPTELHFWKTYVEVLTRCDREEQAHTQLEAARTAGLNDHSLNALRETISETQLSQTDQLKDRDLFQRHMQTALERFPGTPYNHWLGWFHRTIKPATYLEIGVETGTSLEQARPPTRCIGIDPAPIISASITAWAKIYAQPSDDFFRAHDVKRLFDNTPIDLCFIDGYHSFDQALRDFINVEANAHDKTVILFHDIYPINSIIASRERKTQFWTGDTWKVIPLLKEQRPDLSIVTIPTFPSGLAMVTNLDPTSETLDQSFLKVIERWSRIDYQDYAETMPNALNVIKNEENAVLAALNPDTIPSDNQARVYSSPAIRH